MSIHPLNKKIGENIEHLRLVSKKNIKQMASLLELTNTGYRNMERGITEVGIVRLYKIAEILGVPLLELINTGEAIKKIKSETYLHGSKIDSELHTGDLEKYKLEIEFLKRQLKLVTELLNKLIIQNRSSLKRKKETNYK